MATRRQLRARPAQGRLGKRAAPPPLSHKNPVGSAGVAVASLAAAAALKIDPRAPPPDAAATPRCLRRLNYGALPSWHLLHLVLPAAIRFERIDDDDDDFVAEL